ncbi:MAG: thioredoxin domain-containing protein, partial [Gemmatimonadetes bacterium]|nr:thioredoxin domain-containing protein [Gemmatimonadota bacterium]
EGGFYAAQDADSEGEEGLFFTWLLEEIEELLGEEDAALFARYYGVVPEGNFEYGRNILHVENELEGVARFLNVEPERLSQVVERGCEVLLAVRRQRIAPGRDDKILTAWNGLMISAMARAYQVIGEDRYLRAAVEAADFILQRMVCDGRLLHTYKDGRARILAYQDDYACLVNGLLDLYEASFELRFFAAAEHWAAEMVARFWDGEHGGFFYAGAEATDLIVRTKNPFDNATPSGNSMGALALLRLGAMKGDQALWQQGEQTLVLFEQLLRRAPAAGAQMLCALDFYLARPTEVALVGDQDECRTFAAALHRCFVPNKVVLAAGVGASEAEAALPLLEGKLAAGGRAYVCHDATCSRPLTTAADLVEHLKAEG